jgi:hypothetical protein
MDVYKKNIQALSKTHPYLAQLIEDAVVDEDKIKVSRTSKDEIEASYRRDDGKIVIIRDEIDLTHLPNRAKELIEREDWTRVILLLGFGLGRYPEELHKMIGENGILVVYEAVPELIKMTFRERDFSDLLGSERFRLIIGEGKLDLSFTRRHHRDIVRGRFHILKQSACVAMDEPAYERFRNQFLEAKMVADVDVTTGVHRGAEWSDAFLENIPTIMRTAGVSRMNNLFKGRPAIIVSAGPSLEKNIHLLREAKGKAVIIAVDIVVPTLLSVGIIPDIVVVLEANRTQFLVFQDVPLLRSVPAVFSGEVVHESLSSLYPGPTFFAIVHNHPVSVWVQKFWTDSGSYIEQIGGSVSHTAFGLAQLLGADPIALVAQDLSFREKLHAGDVTELFYPDEYIEHHKRKNPIVIDIFGDERYTLSQFLTFRTSFEKKISQMKGKVFNATEGGLPIKGAETIRLRDFIDEYCNVPLIDAVSVLESIGESHSTCDFQDMITSVQHDMARLKEIQKNASKINKIVLRLKELKERSLLNNSEATHLVRTIERLEKKIDDPIIKLVAPYRYRMENYLRHNDIEDENLDMIQDSLNYYGEITKVIGSFLDKAKRLISSLKREAEVDYLLSDESILPVERYFQTGMIHWETGMVREAVMKLEKAATEFSKISDPSLQKQYWPVMLQAYGTLVQLYIKQYRFYDASKILEVLKALTAVNAEAQKSTLNPRAIDELMDTCNQKITIWEELRANKELILRKAQASYGSHLESGAFYYRVGEYDRAVRSYIRAVNERRNLSSESNGDSLSATTRTIRLLGAYYGLAQTYTAMEKQGDALAALDSGCHEVETLHNFDLPEILEEFGVLFIDLFLSLGDIERATSFNQCVLTILPQSVTLREKMRNLMQEVSGQAMEARG